MARIGLINKYDICSRTNQEVEHAEQTTAKATELYKNKAEESTSKSIKDAQVM